MVKEGNVVIRAGGDESMWYEGWNSSGLENGAAAMSWIRGRK